MRQMIKSLVLVLFIALACLALASCTAVTPQPAVPTAGATLVAQAATAALPAATMLAATAPAMAAPSALPSAPPTNTQPPTNTPLPTLTPTPSLTPTIVQGVKDTNVLVNAQLIRVIDGNTIEVTIKGKSYQVRYLGVAAPTDANSAQAAAGNKRLVTGQALRLEKDVTDTDADGRLLRYVYTRTYMVNAEMVRFGYARAEIQPPDTRYQDLFAAMEADARSAKRGLWAAATATPAAPGTAEATPTPRP